MPTFAFPVAPEYLTVLIQRTWNAPLPLLTLCQKSIASVVCLCPIIIHAQPLD